MNAVAVPRAAKVVSAAPPQPSEITAQQYPERRRITTDLCRAILRRPSLTDDESQAIIDHLYLLAEVAADAFVEVRNEGKKREPLVARECMSTGPSLAVAA